MPDLSRGKIGGHNFKGKVCLFFDFRPCERLEEGGVEVLLLHRGTRRHLGQVAEQLGVERVLFEMLVEVIRKSLAKYIWHSFLLGRSGTMSKL